MHDYTSHNSAGYAYFLSFELITSFVIMNMFIMIVLADFDEHFENPESPIDLFNRHVTSYKAVWVKYSRVYKGVKIHGSVLATFLYELGPPLGFYKEEQLGDMMRELTAFGVVLD